MTPDGWIAAAAIAYPALSVAAGLMLGLWISRNRRDRSDGYESIPSRDEKVPVMARGDFRRWEQEMRQS